jgi:hypothetical protein
MAQHDYIIDNATGAAVRADLNNALSAIVTLNSGASAPTTTYAYQPWADITTGLLKLRNAANTSWITVGTLASTNLGLVVGPTGAGTADQVLATDGAGVQSWVDRARLAAATSQNSTSGTSVEFLSIPSWARIIHVYFAGVSTNGTSNLQVQLGTSGGFVTTGYLSGCFTSTASTANSTTGLLVTAARAATTVTHGVLSLHTVTGNQWVATSSTGSSDSAQASMSGGSISLGAALDRVRVIAVNGTDTFDAGVVNIRYEG